MYDNTRYQIELYNKDLERLKTALELKRFLNRISEEEKCFRAGNTSFEAEDIKLRYHELVSNINSKYQAALTNEKQRLLFEILSNSQAAAKKDFEVESKAVSNRLTGGGKNLVLLLIAMYDSIKRSYEENLYWDIADENLLKEKIKIAIDEQKVTNYSVNYQNNSKVAENLTSLLSKQYYYSMMISFFEANILPIIRPNDNKFNNKTSPMQGSNSHLSEMDFHTLFKSIVKGFEIIESYLKGDLNSYEYFNLHDRITFLTLELKKTENNMHYNYYIIHLINKHLRDLDLRIFEGSYQAKINVWDSVSFSKEITELRQFINNKSFEFPKHPGPPTYAQDELDTDTLTELNALITASNPKDVSTVAPNDLIIRNWHYALALVLLQLSKVLPSTIGSRDQTVKQAMEVFRVDSQKARSIYDETSKMRNSRDVSNNWNLNFYFENKAPKYRRDYKSIVKRLLGDNSVAISLLEKLNH